MTKQNVQSTTRSLPAMPSPRTLLGRFVTAVVERDTQQVLTILTAAAERRALPRRILFGPKQNRGCRPPCPASNATAIRDSRTCSSR